MFGTTADLSAMNRHAEKHPPLVIVLLGPPGAGKGTLAVPLSEALQIPHISTGDLFRANIRNQTPIGKKAKSYIDQGQLVPDEVVLAMLFERTGLSDCKGGYILDGFPRTVAQAKALDRQVSSTYKMVSLNFNVPDELLVERITGRLACKECGKPYHLKYAAPQQEGTCDSCHGALYQRDDDREEILLKRLQVYHSQTKPLIDYYAAAGVLHDIDSAHSKEAVFQEVLDALPQTLVVHK